MFYNNKPCFFGLIFKDLNFYELLLFEIIRNFKKQIELFTLKYFLKLECIYIEEKSWLIMETISLIE